MTGLFNRYKQKFFAEEYILVQVNFHDVGKINYLIVKNEGNKIDIIKQGSVDSWEVFLQNLSKNSSLVIHFSGEGVITKKISNGTSKNKELFFGRNPEDFYSYEIFQEEEVYVSICRRSLIDKYIKDLIKISVKTYAIGLGPLTSLSFHLLTQENIIKTTDYSITYDSGKIIEVNEYDNSKELEYRINEDVIKCSEVGTFSTFLNFLNPIENSNQTIPPEILEKKELRENRILKVTGISMLVFFLVSLIISYGVITYFESRYLQYEEKLFYLNETYSTLKKFEKEQQLRESIIAESGLLSQDYISLYLQDIGSSIPDKIHLDELQYNPITKKIKDGDPVSIEMGHIQLVGITPSSSILNDWISALMVYKWCQKIEIIGFSANRNNELQFELKISYR